MMVVREVEEEDLPVEQVRRKYGVKSGGTVAIWVRKYGNGSRGKIIRVEKPEEINEKKRMKERMRQLEAVVADLNVELAVERAYVRIACQRAGIKDVAEFKKKTDGKPGMKR